MIEDDTYRQSSQYRLWSFTPDQLQGRRNETNRLASERVYAAFSRARAAASNGNDADTDGHEEAADTTIDTLTVDEEQRMVQWGCEMILTIKDNLDPRPSSTVAATAIQYLRRFYLTNSPMTYHPRQLTICALWLAMKSSHFHSFTLTRFVSSISNTLTEEDVRAPEFLLMQALRFTLDVRHPIRALEGGVLELRLHASKLSCMQGLKATQMTSRIDVAHDKARALLIKDTQITDAYFLYTPPQIYLATLYLVDKDLVTSYITHLFSRIPTELMPPVRQKLLDNIASCAQLIASYRSPDTDKAIKNEMARIGKKLQRCQDPEKTDIVAVAQRKAAEKRAQHAEDGEAAGAESSDDEEARKEKKAKKRKIEAGKTVQGDGDVFGPDLKSVAKG